MNETATYYSCYLWKHESRFALCYYYFLWCRDGALCHPKRLCETDTCIYTCASHELVLSLAYLAGCKRVFLCTKFSLLEVSLNVAVKRLYYINVHYTYNYTRRVR